MILGLSYKDTKCSPDVARSITQHGYGGSMNISRETPRIISTPHSHKEWIDYLEKKEGCNAAATFISNTVWIHVEDVIAKRGPMEDIDKGSDVKKIAGYMKTLTDSTFSTRL